MIYLFIYEIGWDDILNFLEGKNNRLVLGSTAPDKNVENIFKYSLDEINTNISINSQIKFLKQLSTNKVKYGCFLNLPPLDQVPYFKVINQSKQKELLSIAQKSFFYFADGLGTEGSGISLLPTSEVDSLYSPKVNIALKKGLDPKHPLATSSGVYGSTISLTQDFILSYNKQTASFAKIFNAPLVDLYSLYEKILKDSYVTDDGVKVESKLNGNFFSSDGIHPTAFGQSVIANEVIKAINAQYKMEIPLITTKEYLQTK